MSLHNCSSVDLSPLPHSQPFTHSPSPSHTLTTPHLSWSGSPCSLSLPSSPPSLLPPPSLPFLPPPSLLGTHSLLVALIHSCFSSHKHSPLTFTLPSHTNSPPSQTPLSHTPLSHKLPSLKHSPLSQTPLTHTLPSLTNSSHILPSLTNSSHILPSLTNSPHTLTLPSHTHSPLTHTFPSHSHSHSHSPHTLRSLTHIPLSHTHPSHTPIIFPHTPLTPLTHLDYFPPTFFESRCVSTMSGIPSRKNSRKALLPPMENIRDFFLKRPNAAAGCVCVCVCVAMVMWQ